MKRITIFASAKQIHLMVGHTSLKTILEGFFIIRLSHKSGLFNLDFIVQYTKSVIVSRQVVNPLSFF